MKDSRYSGCWKGRGNKSGEQRARDDEKDNKVQSSVGGQIKNEQKVGSREVKLTKEGKQNGGRQRHRQEPSRTLRQQERS